MKYLREWFRRLFAGKKAADERIRRSCLHLEILESRILYSAAPVEAPPEAAEAPAAQEAPESAATKAPPAEAEPVVEGSSAVPETAAGDDSQSGDALVPLADDPKDDSGEGPLNAAGASPLNYLVINEVLADPANAVFGTGTTSFDTNGDNTISGADDEFIEILNTSGSAVDVSGLQIWDSTWGSWFTVPNSTSIDANGTLLIVKDAVGTGSGSLPTLASGSVAFDAGLSNNGSQIFNDAGDAIRILDTVNNCYIEATFASASFSHGSFPGGATKIGATINLGNSAADGASLTLSPDGSTASPGVDHSTLGDGSFRATPGILAIAPTVTIPNFAEPVLINELVIDSWVSTTLPGITVSDIDSATLTVTITITGGDLSVPDSVGGGVSAGNITGQDTSTLVMTGTPTQINNTFAAGLTIAQENEDPDFNDNIVGSLSTLLITASDGSHQGSDSILVSFVPTNDPPTITTPAAQSVTEDTDLVFTSTNGNLISVDDPDAGELPSPNNVVRVNLNVNSGALTLSTIAGLDFASDGNVGDGTQDTAMTFRGTLSEVNTALAGLTYRSGLNYNTSGVNPADTLSIVVNDLGNAGQDPNVLGQPSTGEEATADITIHVSAINDAPVNVVPGTQAGIQNTTISFNSGNGNAVLVSDVDADDTAAPNNLLQVTLAADNGATVTLTSTTGLDFSFNDASGTGDSNGTDGTIVLRGNATNINNAFNTLSVTPSGGFLGNIDLVVTTNDLGNTGLDSTTAPTTNFNIEMSYPDSSITASQKAVIELAVQKWEEVIIDNGLSLAVDLTINALATAIDGPIGTLATGGFTSLHAGTDLSKTGMLTFDTADIASQETSGALYVLALHELGHALGIGTAWLNANVVNVAETQYTGSNALAAFNYLFGTSVTFIPVEDDGSAAGGHWEEDEGANPLDTELMTGIQDSAADELSIITVGSLQDLGYQVNYLGADTYSGISGAAFLGFLGGGEKTDSDTITINFSDGVGPVLDSFSRQTPAGANTNADILVFRATFSEDVQNVDTTDFAVNGTTTATVTNVSTVNAFTYDITVSGGNLANFDGSVGLNLAAGQNIIDSSSIPLPGTEPAIDETFVIDNGIPDPTITTSSNLIDTTTFVVTIDFGEVVAGFEAGDISVGGGTVQGSVTDNGSGNFSATINAAGEGPVTVDVAANAAQDNAGNFNTAATQLSVSIDLTAPTADLSDVTPDPRSIHAGTVNIEFSEAVTGVDITDFTLTHDLAPVDISGLTVTGSGTDFTLDLSSVSDSEGSWVLTLTAAGSGIEDLAGNGLVADTMVTIPVVFTSNAPVLAHISDKTLPEGSTLNFTASATDDDVPAENLTFSLDGVSLGKGMSISPTTGEFLWNPLNSHVGNHNATVTVTDDSGGMLTDFQTFAINVELLPLTETTEVLIGGGGNLVIRDINGGDTNDQLVLEVIDGELAIRDTAGNDIGSRIPTATQYGLSELRVDLSLLSGDIIVRTFGGNDTINIGDLSGLPGGVTIEDGLGNDLINHIGMVTLLGSGAFDYAAERIVLGKASNLTTESGDITLDANAAGTGTSRFTGLYSHTAALTSATGDINLSGRGGDTSSKNIGVYLRATDITITGGGSLDISGIGGGTTSGNDGVVLWTGTDLSVAAGGTLNLTGTGGAGTGSTNRGIYIHSTTTVQVVDGNLTITGTGGGGKSNSRGVQIKTATLTSSGTGNITLTGTGVGTSSNNTGIDLNRTIINATAGGNITLIGDAPTGAATVTGSSNLGINLNRAEIRATDGDVGLTGTGGGGKNSNDGIRGSRAILNSLNGGISLVGNAQADTTGNSNRGVYLRSGALGAGTNVSIDGAGGNGKNTNEGLHNSGGTITATNGSIILNGTALATTFGSKNTGAQIKSTILTAATGITVAGMAGNGTSGNVGTILNRAELTATDSPLTIAGTAQASTTGTTNRGIDSRKSILSGNIVTLSATGGNGTNSNEGLRMTGGSITATAGTVTITAGARATTTGSNNSATYLKSTPLSATAGIEIAGTGGGGKNTNYGVYLSAPTADAGAGTFQIQGTAQVTTFGSNNRGVYLQKSAVSGTTVTINATGGSGTSNNEGLRSIGGSINATGGAITITADAQGTTTSSNNSGAYFKTTPLSAANGISIIGNGGGGKNTNYGVYLASPNVDAGVGNASVMGTSQAGTLGSKNIGVYLQKSALTGIDITLTGNGGGGTSNNQGVRIIGGSVLANAGGGTTEIVGGALGTTTSANNSGVYVFSKVTLGGATITLEGTGGGGTKNNHGLYMHSKIVAPGAVTTGVAGQGLGSLDESGDYFLP